MSPNFKFNKFLINTKDKYTQNTILNDKPFEDIEGKKAKAKNELLPERIKHKIGSLIEFFLLKKVFLSLLALYVLIVFPFSKIEINSNSFLSSFFWKQYFDYVDTELKILASYIVTIAITSFVSSKINNK